MKIKEVVTGSRKCADCAAERRRREGVSTFRKKQSPRPVKSFLLEEFPGVLDFLPDVDKEEISGIGISSTHELKLTCPHDDRHVWNEKVKSFYSRATRHPERKTPLCPVCAGRKIIVGVNDLATTHPELSSQLVDTSLATGVTALSSRKLEWKCDLGHVWTAMPSHRSKGTGCPYCSGNMVLPGFNDLATVNPSLADELTDQSLATTLTFSSGKMVSWTCEKGHSWESKVSTRNRSDSTGCPYCSNKKVWVGFNDLATTHPELADELTDPSQGTTVVAGSMKKLNWTCDKGHSWDATVVHRRNGSGCPYCTNRKVDPGFNSLRHTHPKMATELSDPSLGDKISAGTNRKVEWVCDKGHRWVVSVSDRINYQTGCPYCSRRKLLQGFNDMATTHPELAKQLLDQSLATTIVAGSAQKVEWICGKGHKWLISPAARSRGGTGCPECVDHSSRAEREVADYVTSVVDNDVITNTRSVITPYELDIYIPEKRIAVEFNGLYWHSEKQGKHKNYHYEKWKRCKEQGIQLITVWEDEWRDKSAIVKKMLSSKLGVDDSPRVYARKTEVRSIDFSISSTFLDDNHIQGSQHGSHYSGLFQGDGLVAVAVWRKNKEIIYLDRYATSVRVVGGMGKLLKSGIRYAQEHGCTEIVTFADHQVSDGGLYEKLGFRLDKELEPDYRYLVDGHREHKFRYRLKRFRDDPDLFYQEGFSERELADLNGLERVWDCGKSRYVYDIS